MWLILAIASAFLFALNNILGRILAVKSDNPRVFALIYNLWGGLFALLLWLLRPEEIRPVPGDILLLVALMIVLYGIFNRYEFFARKYIELSNYVILARIVPIVAFILSIFFLQESISFNKIIAAIIIFSGSLLIVYRKGISLKTDSGLKYGLTIFLSLGAAWVVDKKASSYFPIPFYAFLAYVLPTIFLLPFPLVRFREIVDEMKIARFGPPILALVNLSAYYFLLSAYQYGEGSKIFLVTSLSTIISVLVGVIIFKEKDNLAKKILAASLVLIGILLLS